ncbi:MAG: PLP-dependent aminotransferase family protein [SAR324 cluster bacterium]|nr:PLP-dependent aminotransferase family protein [SAR324 cluster bacterium]
MSAVVTDNPRGLADRIVSDMIESISGGDVTAGTRLPSIRAMAERMGVNRNTVAHAYRELAEKGYLETRYGGGSYAAHPQPFAIPREEAATHSSAEPPAVARFGEEDWELRFARRLGGLLQQSGKPPLLQPEEGGAINLFQLRPNTDLFVLEQFRNCLNTVLRRSGKQLLNYGAPAGYLPLREQIAVRLRSLNIQADPGQILITSGSQQGIDLLARAFLDLDDGVVVESPTYAIALKIFQANGARLIPYTVGREGVSFQPLEGFALQSSPKLFYAVPNFQNPTTHSYTAEERQALLRHVYRAGSILIEDAYHTELQAEPRAALAAMDRSQRVVYLNTFSKTLVPALRVGYLMGPPAVVRRLTELKEMTDLSQSLILQAAIAEFLERGHFDAHVATVRRFYQERIAKVSEMLDAALPEEAPFTRPGGGLFIWVDLPQHVDTEMLYQRLRQKGVLVSPGALFQPFPGGRNGLRLCVASESEERLRKGIELLGEELKQLLRRPAPTLVERDYQATH